MSEQVTTNTGQGPGEVLADAGCCSEANLNQAAAVSAQTGTGFFIATGRHQHEDPAPVAPRGPTPKNATLQATDGPEAEDQARPGRLRQRQVIVEPVFAQMATLQNGKRLLLRGLDGARGEWLLLAARHNLRKLHAKIGTDGLAALATR